MNSITDLIESSNLNFRELSAIAQHLGCGIRQLLLADPWRFVIWVKFIRKGKICCRFVSYKVIWGKMPGDSGLYYLGNKTVRVEVFGQSFRWLNPTTREVLGWADLKDRQAFDAQENPLSFRVLSFEEYPVEGASYARKGTGKPALVA